MDRNRHLDLFLLYLASNRNAIYLAAITGGLADLGYFLFMDLGGHVNFMPGTVMTLFSAEAIILSFYGSFGAKDKA